MNGLPPYVARLGHGEVTMMPAGVVDQATIAMFAAKVDGSKLQRYVDLVLTERGGPSYFVLDPMVILCFLDSPHLTSATQQIGFVADHEVAVWVPLIERDGDRLRFVVWMPYIWVDTDIAMATGREVWGFPKSIGSYAPPANHGDPHILTTRIFKTFDPTKPGEEAELIRVDPGSADYTSAWSGFEDMAKAMTSALGWSDSTAHFSLGDDLRLAVDFAKMAFTAKIPVVNLKQFRDSVDGAKACYQAIIGSDLQLAGFHGGGPILGSHQITVTNCASHRLIDDLGLPDEPFKALFGAWVKMDFLANPGAAVWTAT